MSRPPSRTSVLCLHCHFRRGVYARRLCLQCWSDPLIRERYPPKPSNKGGPRIEDKFSAPLPSKPTKAPPGSMAKIKVMRERAMRGEQLFHPKDAK